MNHILVVKAGFSSSVLARKLATRSAISTIVPGTTYGKIIQYSGSVSKAAGNLMRG